MRKKREAQSEGTSMEQLPTQAVTTLPATMAYGVELLTIPQVAKRLHLSRTKVYDLIEHEGLPVVRFGRAVRVQLHALALWLEVRCQPVCPVGVSAGVSVGSASEASPTISARRAARPRSTAAEGIHEQAPLTDTAARTSRPGTRRTARRRDAQATRVATPGSDRVRAS